MRLQVVIDFSFTIIVIGFEHFEIISVLWRFLLLLPLRKIENNVESIKMLSW